MQRILIDKSNSDYISYVAEFDEVELPEGDVTFSVSYPTGYDQCQLMGTESQLTG